MFILASGEKKQRRNNVSQKLCAFDPQGIRYINAYTSIICKPAMAASSDCLSSKVMNRSALIDNAEATCKISSDLDPVFWVWALDKARAL